MSALDDLKARVASLDGKVVILNTKSDALIDALKSARTQLATLQASGSASPAEIAAVIALMDTTAGKVDVQIGEDDAALNPAAPPTPPQVTPI